VGKKLSCKPTWGEKKKFPSREDGGVVKEWASGPLERRELNVKNCRSKPKGKELVLLKGPRVDALKNMGGKVSDGNNQEADELHRELWASQGNVKAMGT